MDKGIQNQKSNVCPLRHFAEILEPDACNVGITELHYSSKKWECQITTKKVKQNISPGANRLG